MAARRNYVIDKCVYYHNEIKYYSITLYIPIDCGVLPLLYAQYKHII